MLTISKFTEKYGIKITTQHNDKMQGLSSLSTSPLCNELCNSRRDNPGMVCSHCFSMAMNRRFRNLRAMLEKNSAVLTSQLIPAEDMPRLYSETGYFRFESFGDLGNAIQAANYLNMAAANSHMQCALWTKNPWFIAEAIEKYGAKKPENLTIIGSSYFLNKHMNNLYDQYDFIDYIFTVFDKAGQAATDTVITCGGRSCADCGKCYTKSHENRHICELLK